MFTYIDLVNEVKRRAIRDQSGTEYDTAIKNAINTSLFTIAREARWRVLRRKTFFDTISSYTSGSNFVLVTRSSTAFSLVSTACDLWANRLNIDRYVKFGTDSWYYRVRAINSNTNGVIDIAYRGTTSTRTTYEIFPQGEYSLPVQVDHRTFLWHEDYGYPFLMYYIPDQTFLETGVDLVEKSTPTHYRMWGEDFVQVQPPTATPITVTLSSSTDSAVQVIIAGKVGGYPLTELIGFGSAQTTTNSAYQFESVERVAKDSGTNGTVTFTSSRGSYTIAVLPSGDTTATVKYSKIQLYPLPTRVFPINVYYYKDPYRLVNDDDVHELGQSFDEAIILLTVAKIKAQDSQQEAAAFYKLFADELANLKKTNIDKIDWTPTLRRPGEQSVDPYVHKNLLFRQAGGAYGPSSRR